MNFKYKLPPMGEHWARGLQEAGTILYKSQTQELLAMDIRAREQQIKRMYEEYGDNERDIVKLASLEWSSDEIATAQKGKTW